MSEQLRDYAFEGAANVSEQFRASNQRIAEQALLLHFVSRVPFICECSDPGCREFVLLPPGDYETARRGGTAYVTLPGHSVAAALSTDRHGDYWVHATG